MIGLGLWLLGLAAAVIAPFRRRGPPSLEPWKLGLIAVTVAWLVQANFAPLAYAFDNYIPWLFAGIALGVPQPATARVREPEAAEPRSAWTRRAEGWIPAG